MGCEGGALLHHSPCPLDSDGIIGQLRPPFWQAAGLP